MTQSPTTSISTPGRRFLWYHLPAILYGLMIIAVSSLRNLRPPDLDIPQFDKLIHLIEYAFFALLIFRSFYHLGRQPNLRRSLLLSALFVSFFALADEIYQRFVPGRHSDWKDFVVDLLGALLVLLLFGLFRRRWKRKSY